MCEENRKKHCPLKFFVERLTIKGYARNTGEKDFSVLTCVDASQHKDTNTVFNLSIRHAIVEYWPQSVRQVSKLQSRLVHRNGWNNFFHLRVFNSTQLGCARSVIIQQ